MKRSSRSIVGHSPWQNAVSDIFIINNVESRKQLDPRVLLIRLPQARAQASEGRRGLGHLSTDNGSYRLTAGVYSAMDRCIWTQTWPDGQRLTTILLV